MYQDILNWSEGRQYLILFQDLFWENEIVEEILILGDEELGLEDLLGQLNLQNPKARKQRSKINLNNSFGSLTD